MKLLGKLEDENDGYRFDFQSDVSAEGDFREAREKLGINSERVNWSDNFAVTLGTVLGMDRRELIDFREYLAQNKDWEYDEP